MHLESVNKINDLENHDSKWFVEIIVLDNNVINVIN